MDATAARARRTVTAVGELRRALRAPCVPQLHRAAAAAARQLAALAAATAAIEGEGAHGAVVASQLRRLLEALTAPKEDSKGAT